MAEITIEEIRDFLKNYQGREVSYNFIRTEKGLAPGGRSWHGLRKMMERLTDERIVRPIGKNSGVFRVVRQVTPVHGFYSTAERRPPFDLMFPRNYDTMMEMDFAEDVVIYEGDMVLIAGLSNFGKTTLAMNFCAENIGSNPVLMGSEYTNARDEPLPRFLNRLDGMEWVDWVNGNGEERFTLLPVREDYAEHIVEDRINIIDWINIDGDRLYEISKTMDSIKKNIGRGIAIICIQMGEGKTSGRGGQFTKDYADCELLIDKFKEDEVLLTIGKVKQKNRRVMGRTFAYMISQGVKIINFREVVKCPSCYGKGWVKGPQPCPDCDKVGYVDK